MTNDIENMIADIERETYFTRQLTGKDTLSEKVITAMRNVPREQFVPPELRALAYMNGPLEIGYRQTISQPFIVGIMTELLALKPDYKVLEIGTGSGYQTAVLSLLAEKVYSVEVIDELAQTAQQRLHTLNYSNIEFQQGNGYEGWPEHAPYDAIIVTAAAAYIPPALIEQLKPNRNMVIPIGRTYFPQSLQLINKDPQNNITTQHVLDVSFVPLVEEAATDH